MQSSLFLLILHTARHDLPHNSSQFYAAIRRRADLTGERIVVEGGKWENAKYFDQILGTSSIPLLFMVLRCSII